ncbi:hypothetical protein [Legionella sp. WA2022007384]
MTGYFKLGDIVYPYLFKENETNFSPLELSHVQRGNVVIVRNSIPVGSLKLLLGYLKRNNLNHMHVLVGVEGQGATEQHIVTMHLPPNGAQPKIYDSKYSNPERFFAKDSSKNTTRGILAAALHSLNPFARSEQSVDLSHLGSEIHSATYYTLGTQSFFDGITCGYHTGSVIEALASLLGSGDDPNPTELLDALKNPVTDSAKKLRAQEAPITPDMSIFSFWIKAWQDTFLPLTEQGERSKYHFGHYFLGWPSDKGSKIAYAITLKFITAPLTNLLSLLTEFPLNFLSETCSFLKNRTLSWAPTNWFTQSIRSVLLLSTMGLQGLFKGTYYLIRTVTSPIASFKDAQKVHPALGYLSALASLCFIGAAIGALAFFAPPLAAALMPSMGPGALSMLSTLAYPFIELFSLISLSIPTATGAMLSLITLASSFGVMHLLGRKTIYPEETPTPPVQHKEIHIEPPEIGSNVSALLPSENGLSKDDVWVDVGDDIPIKKEQKSNNDFKPNDIQATIVLKP